MARPIPLSKLYKSECYVCGDPARFQWNACADGNVWRPLCKACDVAINISVLQVLYPVEWLAKVKAYCNEIEFNYEERFNEKGKRRSRNRRR